MQVLRLETRDGYGPYIGMNLDRHDFREFIPTFLDDDPQLHPHPVHDNLGYSYADWVFGDHDWASYHFGFKDSEQIGSWFFVDPRDAWALSTVDLMVVKYEIDPADVRIGDSQVMFVKKQATKVDSYGTIEYARLQGWDVVLLDDET